MEPLKWNKIDISTHLTSEMTSYHVNMKHFYGMYTVEPLAKYESEDNKYFSNFNKLYDLLNGDKEIEEKYLMERDRVMPFIFSIRELNKLNEVVNGGTTSVNYLRFFPYKGKYVVTNDCEPFEWNGLTSKTFRMNKTQ